jgi:hypothetical protein
MGDEGRANRFGDQVTDPLMKKLVKRAFKSCGNCPHRITCACDLIDVRRALDLINKNAYNMSIKPSLASKTAARVYTQGCVRCDRLGRCVHYLAHYTYKDEAEKALMKLKDRSEEDIAIIIENVLDDQCITTRRLIQRVFLLWLKCEQNELRARTR